MTYGVVVTTPAPIEMYDAVHREVTQRTGAAVDGLLLHVGRANGEGFQVIEVWESKEQYDRYTEQLVWPIVAELSGGAPPAAADQTTEEFEVRGLVIPQGNIVR